MASKTFLSDVNITGGDLNVTGSFSSSKSSVRVFNASGSLQSITAGSTNGTTVLFPSTVYDVNSEFTSNRFTNNSGQTKSYLVTFHTYQGIMSAGETLEFFIAPNVVPSAVSTTTMHAYNDMIYYIFHWDSGLQRTDFNGVVRLASTEWFELGVFFGGAGSHSIGNSGTARFDLLSSMNIEEL